MRDLSSADSAAGPAKCVAAVQEARQCSYTIINAQLWIFPQKLGIFLFSYSVQNRIRTLQRNLHNYLLYLAWAACLASWLVCILRGNHD